MAGETYFGECVGCGLSRTLETINGKTLCPSCQANPVHNPAEPSASEPITTPSSGIETPSSDSLPTAAPTTETSDPEAKTPSFLQRLLGK